LCRLPLRMVPSAVSTGIVIVIVITIIIIIIIVVVVYIPYFIF
jgi:hypothetical protein